MRASKYPVSVGVSGFGTKGVSSLPILSQSIQEKNGICITSLAAGLSVGSIVSKSSTASTALDDKASSPSGHSISGNQENIQVNKTNFNQYSGIIKTQEKLRIFLSIGVGGTRWAYTTTTSQVNCVGSTRWVYTTCAAICNNKAVICAKFQEVAFNGVETCYLILNIFIILKGSQIGFVNM